MIDISLHTNRLLGYPPDARLLIINADDFGMCHAVNQAIIRALEAGLLRSTTLMAPCPWAVHAMRFLADHPEIPFGVHLTAISDGVDYRWRPLTSREKVPSLIDQAGYFYNFEHMPEFLAQVRLDQLEMEFKAQIETVLAAGLKPTHLDWHALRIGGRADIQDLMLKLAKEYGLALRVAGRSWIEKVQSQDLPTNDHDFLDSYLLDPADKPARFHQLLRQLPAGSSEWAVHPGLDSAELLAIEPGGRHVRQTDFDFLMSQEAKDIVEEQGIILLDYRPLQAIWNTVSPAVSLAPITTSAAYLPAPFVPDDFEIPAGLETAEFRLRMLTVNDVVKDFEAVVTSAEHLKQVFPGGIWPDGLTLEQDLIDLGWHQKEFQNRTSFAYTVVTPSETQVLGCVYIYPARKLGYDAVVYLWARHSELAGGLEGRLTEAVKRWIAEQWPFRSVAYPGRGISWEDYGSEAESK